MFYQTIFRISVVNSLSTQTKKRNVILTVSALLVIVATAAALVVLALSMQTKPKTSNVNLSADDVVTGVIKKMNYQNLTPISKENISRYYEIPDDTVCDYAMYISGRAGSETELTCFKLKGGADEQKLMQNISDYLSFKTPTPAVSGENVSAQTAPLNTSTAVLTHHPFIFVAVAQDSSSALKAFDALIVETPRQDSSQSSKAKS